jgi:hypothetical protein
VHTNTDIQAGGAGEDGKKSKQRAVRVWYRRRPSLCVLYLVQNFKTLTHLLWRFFFFVPECSSCLPGEAISLCLCKNRNGALVRSIDQFVIVVWGVDFVLVVVAAAQYER